MVNLKKVVFQTVLACLSTLSCAQLVQAQTVYFPVPANSRPHAITAGPNSSVYIANYAGSSAMRMYSTVTHLWKSLISISAGPGHGGQFNPTGITAKDGHIWVIGNYSVSGSYLIKLSPSGKILLRKPLDSKGVTSLISRVRRFPWYYLNAWFYSLSAGSRVGLSLSFGFRRMSIEQLCQIATPTGGQSPIYSGNYSRFCKTVTMIALGEPGISSNQEFR